MAGKIATTCGQKFFFFHWSKCPQVRRRLCRRLRKRQKPHADIPSIRSLFVRVVTSSAALFNPTDSASAGDRAACEPQASISVSHAARLLFAMVGKIATTCGQKFFFFYRNKCPQDERHMQATAFAVVVGCVSAHISSDRKDRRKRKTRPKAGFDVSGKCGQRRVTPAIAARSFTLNCLEMM